MKLVLILISIIVASSKLTGAVLEQGSASVTTPTPRIDKQQLDAVLMRLLEDWLPMDTFSRLAMQYSAGLQNKLSKMSVRNLHSAFFAHRKFILPCDKEVLIKLAEATIQLHRLKDERFKLIMEYLLQDRSAVDYALKCIGEFDVIARELFHDDAFAKDTMARLISSIKTTRLRIGSIQDDLDPFLPRNIHLALMLENNDFRALCNKTGDSSQVERMLNIFSTMLGPVTIFRQQALLMRFSEEAKEDEPNTFKLLSLALFCRCYTKQKINFED